MPATPNAARSEGVVRWSHDDADRRLVAAATYGFVAVFGGLLALVLGGVAVVAAVAALSGELGTLALVAVLGLVGGPLSLLYLWPMIRDPDQRPPLPGPLLRDARLGPALGAVVAGAIGHAAAVALWPVASLALLVGGALVPGAIVTLLAPEGELDPDAPALSHAGRSIPLDRLTGFRRVRVAGVVLYWLGYDRGAWAAGPRLVSVPDEADGAVRPVLVTAAAELEPVAAGRDPNRGVQALLVVVGLSFLGVAGFFAFAVGSIAPGVRYYVALVIALLGSVFLFGAYAEG